jgi:uncharacterized protein YhbP (UPF0306 family)
VSEATREAVRQMLAAHHTLTLASGSGDAPWAATVFYASDAEFNLYFVSDERTRHGRDMARNSSVAVAINADVDNWDDVRGLQIAGRAHLVSARDRPQVLELYLEKFPSVRALYATPRDANEELIATRLKQTAFWRVRPYYIRLIDNRRGFGFKEELRFQP